MTCRNMTLEADIPMVHQSKRTLDIVICITAIVILITPALLIALLIKLTSRGPILFKQTRLGINHKQFTMLKFRTMMNDSEDSHLVVKTRQELENKAKPINGLFKAEDDPRVTSVGRILRKFSLDELPQLINVLRGEMSIVGPRPCLPCEAELFPIEYQERFRVLPGLTGLWQVNGRNALDTKQMLELDRKYAEQWSMKLDLDILIRTPKAVIWDRRTA